MIHFSPVRNTLHADGEDQEGAQHDPQPHGEVSFDRLLRCKLNKPSKCVIGVGIDRAGTRFLPKMWLRHTKGEERGRRNGSIHKKRTCERSGPPGQTISCTYLTTLKLNTYITGDCATFSALEHSRRPNAALWSSSEDSHDTSRPKWGSHYARVDTS